MKLSCIETMLGEPSLAGKFELAREAGFDGLDLRGDQLAPVVDEVRELTARSGIEVPHRLRPADDATPGSHRRRANAAGFATRRRLARPP